MSRKSKKPTYTPPPTPPPPPPVVPRVRPAGTREALTGALESLASTPAPDRATWMSLCAHVEALHTQHGDATAAVEAVRARVTAWPTRLRMAPWLWINKLLANALPTAALGLVSGLPMTAAIGDNAAQNARREPLLAWLASLPAEAPAPGALVLSWRREAREAVQRANAREADARFHASIPSERQYHWEEGILEAILRSPLARDLTAFDASLPVPVADFGERAPGVVDGNTAAFARVLALLGALKRTPRLALLDLRGNTLRHGADALQKRYALPALRVLDVGMSAPVGDDLLAALAASAPALEALHTVPDCTGDLLDLPFAEWSEESQRNIEQYWSVRDPSRPARFTAAGLKGLLQGCPALKLLVLQSTYRRDEAITALLAAHPGLTVGWAGSQSVSVEHGAWPLAAHYDLDEPV